MASELICPRFRAVSSARTFVLVTCLVILASGASGSKPAADHVILLSIDGWGAEWQTVVSEHPERFATLHAMMAEGVRAERLIGVFPTLTYPSHATMVTGGWPSDHGIVTNYDTSGEWLLSSRHLQLPTIWDSAHDHGLSVALVNWPITHDAEVDFLIPQNLDFYATDLAEQVRNHSTPGLFESLGEATGKVVMLPFLDHDAGVPLDRMTGRFAAEIIRRHQPNLLLAHFLDLDHRQHLDGPMTESAYEALEHIDQLIGDIRQATRESGIENSTAIMVVSDHGFAEVDTAVCLPVVFDEAGLPQPGASSEDPSDVRIWMARATVAVDAKDGLDAEGKISNVVRERLKDVVSIIDRRQLDSYNAFPEADFALTAAPGFIFSTSGCDELLVPSDPFRGAHGYPPDEPSMAASLVAMGSGIRTGKVLPKAHMTDVAPTIAVLLGAPFYAPAGSVLSELFTEADESL